ncbi:uncharacterized protein LOC134534250 [Bacillus rossius redtenbacheri]|uniref:uncharacterized protein LOC134534250 n=1 Tax=Bacillus rossius redtenbacheri TaxID=93214 RepID=UPI002FDCC7E8
MMNRVDRYHEDHQQLLRRADHTALMLPPPPLVDDAAAGSRAASWTSEGGSVLERWERIRPERAHRRNNVQKMQWRSSRWVSGFPRGAADEELDQRVCSMTIADVSPRFAVKRIIFLYENFQYREAANFVNRLSHGTFKVILNDLPIDLFVESMPHSLSILEALYAKVFLSDGLNFSMKLLRPEGVVMQMVKFFSLAQDKDRATTQATWEPSCGPFVSSCKKLLKVIVLSDPKSRKLLQQRKRGLDKAIEGLGQHGLVGTSDESLTNLHDALRVEFRRVAETYKGALQKLEELSLATAHGASPGVTRGPAPVQASHQRQLSLRQPEIQERLIKNKTLLNVVEPTLGNHSLDILLGILQRRVEFDKDVLFQFTQLRKEMKEVEAAEAVAPVLLRYSHGCDQVLELMKEVAEDDDDSSDISGYHSDSDSAIMMSGNSPYVSKRARHNFLTRSVRSSKLGARTPLPLQHQFSSSSGVSSQRPCSSGSEARSKGASPDASSTASSGPIGPYARRQLAHKLGSAASSTSSDTVACCQGCQPHATVQAVPQSNEEELVALRSELANLQEELSHANSKVLELQEAKRALQERLALPGHGDAARGDDTAQQLVRGYASLYAAARVDTLDALDNLPPLRDAHELKSKILFSVIVLAFRSTQALLALKKDHVRRVLHIPAPAPGAPPPPAVAAELEHQVELYLRRTVATFDLTKCADDVCSQIWATLYDYPCLKECAGLVQYVRNAVRLAWGLINQSPPHILEYEQRMFRKDVHVRFHTSNPESEQIRTYLWPALLEGTGGPCLHKAVVIT